ncbi:MAG: hypothetical protein ACTS2F_00940 [Thainema sp.]
MWFDLNLRSRFRRLNIRYLSQLHLGQLRIWFLLPVVGLVVWLSAGLLSQQVLSYSYEISTQLQSEQPQVELTWQVTVVAIEAAIDRREGATEVTVRTAHPVLKELELDLPVIEFAEIETALATELRLPQTTIKQLVRYRLD